MGHGQGGNGLCLAEYPGSKYVWQLMPSPQPSWGLAKAIPHQVIIRFSLHGLCGSRGGGEGKQPW